jgi:hypothetical protein
VVMECWVSLLSSFSFWKGAQDPPVSCHPSFIPGINSIITCFQLRLSQ